MFSFMPQSMATTLYLASAVREYQRFLQLTRETASLGTGVSAMIFSASAAGVSGAVIRTLREPKSRMLRVSCRVSMPEMPGMPYSSNSSERVFTQRKLEGVSL